MSADPAVVAALTAALDADPTNRSVRAHLAQVLLGGGELDDADRHVRVLLDGDPADVGAIALGVRRAEALGQLDRALGYLRRRR